MIEEVYNALTEIGNNPFNQQKKVTDIEFEIKVPNRPTYIVYLKANPKKCSKCDGKGHKGWNVTRNYPNVCKCVRDVYVDLKEIVGEDKRKVTYFGE